MTITIDKQGRRFYLRGDTYAVRSGLKGAGAKWDPDTRCWYTGRQATADAIVAEFGGSTAVAAAAVTPATADRLTDSSPIVGRAKYKGREYLLVWEGNTRRGPSAKLAFLDGSSIFWTAPGTYEVTKYYQTRERYGRDEPMTFGRLSRLRDEFRDQKQAAEQQTVVGERSDIQVEYTASRQDRKPACTLGSTRWIKHQGERIACTLIGYETAVFVRGEDAEDMGHYGVRDGWYGVAYYRTATDAEQSALELTESPARTVQRAQERRLAVEAWLTTQLKGGAHGVTTVSDTGRLPPEAEIEATIEIGRKVTSSGAVTDGGTTYALTATSVVAHHGGYYDDYRSSTRTVERTDELVGAVMALASGDDETISVCADRITAQGARA
jgi:hypothetical protein